MQLHLKVTTNETTYDVSTNLGVIVAWERKYKRKASDMAQGVGIEDLAFLAYESAKHKKIVVPASFDDYISKLVNIEVVEQEPAGNHIPGAPTDAN